MADPRPWPVKRGNHGHRVFCDPKLFLALGYDPFQPMHRQFGGGMGRKPARFRFNSAPTAHDI